VPVNFDLGFGADQFFEIHNFDFGSYLLSWNQKCPPPKRRASEWIAVRIITGYRWHGYQHPAPWCPGGTPGIPIPCGYRC